MVRGSELQMVRGARFRCRAFLPNQQTWEVSNWLTNPLTEFLSKSLARESTFFAMKSRNRVTGVTHFTYASRLAWWECKLQGDLAHTPTPSISGSIPP